MMRRAPEPSSSASQSCDQYQSSFALARPPLRNRLVVEMVLCCGVNARLVEMLESSSHSFICADWCQQPLLFLYGLTIAMLQMLLLLLVWARAEANMFYEFYSHGMINITSFEAMNTQGWQQRIWAELEYHFPSPELLSTLGQTELSPEVQLESIAAAGPGGASFAPAVNSSASLERYNMMLVWSQTHPYLPKQVTHPDLQLDYALVFSLVMIVVWASKDAVTAITAFCSGHLLVSATMAINVVLALLTGYDQMYVRFLPIFVFDTPANVIGISPISMILDSVAVMLIFDLDDKAYSMMRSIARGPVLKLQKQLANADKQHASLREMADEEMAMR